MLSYEVTFADTSLKNLARYPKKDQQLIVKNIEELAQNPNVKSNVKKLVDFDVSYRLKIGNYRVLFEKEDGLKIIDVIDVLRRDKVYRRK